MTNGLQTILMCAPDFFGIDYVINPWMEGKLGGTEKTLVQKQWNDLKETLAAETELAFVPPVAGLPDMVFTANAGLVLGKRAIVSRFRAPERQGEEPHFLEWFRLNGFTIVPWPKDVAFEGAGDALMDRGQPLIWVGHGFRSDATAPALIEHFLERRAVALHLVDPRFYHLDTCLCPLAGGYLMYFPAAFDADSQRMIAELVPEEKRIVVPEEDALKFACNAVDINGRVVMNGASEALQTRLKKAGFKPTIVNLSEFMKSGGAAKCLTLKLVES